jgi:alanine racemase
MKENHRCWAEIDRSALRGNVAFLRQKFGPGVEFLAVVKANAYGHGMIDVARTIADQTNIFGVANLEEATVLRGAVQNPIAILGPALPEERPVIAERAFIPSVSTLEEARDFDRVAGGRKVPVIFKIDTGMGRMGVLEREAVAVFKEVHALSSVEVHSVSTHLTVSDQDEEFTRGQLDHFARLIRQLRAEIPGDYKAHVLQTAGVLAFAEEPFEIVRPGMLIYGISSRLASSNEVEGSDRPYSRHAGWTRHQLRPHFYHSKKNACGHSFLWLRRWIPASPFQSGNLSTGSRSTLPAPGSGNDGSDDDRRFASACGGGGR